MNYLKTPQAPDHLSLTILLCLSEQCNHCGNILLRKYRLYKHMLVVNGASRPMKILPDRYLTKLMASRRISFVICYIAFKTRISFKKHMNKGAHMLSHIHENVKGRIVN